MELTTIGKIFKNREDYIGKNIRIGGWVRSVRDSKTWKLF